MRRSGEAAVGADTWRLAVEPDGATGAQNMAIDQAMLDQAVAESTATLRLYRFNPPCLSLGRNQVGLQFDGLDVVRRPTGGGAVWHEHEVTYAVAAPMAAFGSLRAAYRAIHEVIASALRTLGVDTTLAPDRLTVAVSDRRLIRPPDRRFTRPPDICFSSPTGGEILANGRKVVGSAQVRKQGAFLQHGSILLGGSQERVGPMTGHGYTTLQDVLGRRVTFDEVADAVVQAWGGAVFATSQS